MAFEPAVVGELVVPPGTWLRSSFDLTAYTGQRLRIRGIGETWNLGTTIV